ncbi:putative RNA-binding protein (RRM superfamily) [Handroanthus impetiginosus]|uniref:Putative RNA-binding protein (RRM superfamily) n=1 Tax=Handroanthus impetiginosus TaxID=429701 RepID=A0A2G9G357_9LAMI|nr:putative RNA-binding protein (RRM superfamily) [Handroanthus impetiginosus]
MNPLTLVKRIQNLNKKEANLGISEEASWHAKYKDSAYIFVGGIPFDLTEGDLLAIFAQYGEVVDVNLVRDKGTGKSKGFAFLAYEDQRSTNLAVDNLNGAQILGRIIRVDHVNKYKKLEEEDEETRQQKREERGVCRAFQRGECNRGDSCKFSHDEQRAANTGWGAEEDRHSRWAQDKFEGSRPAPRQGHKNSDEDSKYSRAKGYERSYEGAGSSAKDHERRVVKTKKDDVTKDRDIHYSPSSHRRSRPEPSFREERDRMDEKRSRKYEPESYHSREDKYGRERDGRSDHDKDASTSRHRRRHRRRRDEDE